MLVKKADSIRSSEITPKSVYLNRRRFLRGAAAGVALAAARPLWDLATPAAAAPPPGQKLTGLVKSPFSTTEKMTSYEDVELQQLL